VCVFTKPVHNYEDDLFAFRFRQPFDEIHANVNERGLWYGQWLQQS
jgi:hypothetical protein